MFAWPVSRIAGAIARVTGASAETANVVRATVAGACFPLDPLGSALGVGHALAAEGARSGDSGAKAVNSVMNVAGLVVTVPVADLPDLPDTSGAEATA